MGMNSFAPYKAGDKGAFVIKNIAPSKKTIRIFHNPILFGQTRDLLEIEGVSESSIRASCLKGEIRNKILAGEAIIISSDVDLLQFNSLQKSFLQSAGVTVGLEVGSTELTPAVIDLIAEGGTGNGTGGDGYCTSDAPMAVCQLIHFIDEGPAQGYSSGAFKEILPEESVFPTNVIWWTSVAKTNKIVEKNTVWNSDSNPTSIQWKMYGDDGLTVIANITDTITYAGPFEINRVRTIS